MSAAKRAAPSDNEDNDSHRSVSVARSEEGTRPPFTSSHKITRDNSKFHLLIGVSGSIAVIKLEELIKKLYDCCPDNRLYVKVVATESAMRMIETQDFEIEETIYENRDEWSMWRRRGDPVLHIADLNISVEQNVSLFGGLELRKWADAMLIAPLDANTMAKIVAGMCDNLLTSVVRAWDPTKPLYYAPAMNTMMWENPLTYQHRKTMKDFLMFKEIPPVEKTLMCGDQGVGAMAGVQMMATIMAQLVRNKFAVYTQQSEVIEE